GRPGSRASPHPARCVRGRGGAAPGCPTGTAGRARARPLEARSSLRRATRGCRGRLGVLLRELLLDVRPRPLAPGFLLLLARVLLVALHVVALFLGDVVLAIGLGFRDLALVARRGVFLRVELGLGDLLLRLGFFLAHVLLVALHRLALGLGGFVIGLDAVFLGVLDLAVRAAVRAGLGRVLGHGALRLGAGACGCTYGKRQRGGDRTEFERHG